ncbi:MAG: four helix bundle protein [Bacteroidota bacterium]|nr:four helix bundle protein [Bacteroidota bacterium]
MKKNLIEEKSFEFAKRIVKMYTHLKDKKQEFILSKQVLKCGTSIGANVHEAIYAESKSDFIHKLKIALKEANETKYWLRLLFETGFIQESAYISINKDSEELIKLLTAIIKSTSKNEDSKKI